MKEIIKKLNGHVIGIGLDEDLIKLIDKNKNITVCDLLDSCTRKEKKQKGIKGRTISIRNLRRVFKKKKFDYIICNYDSIKKYLNTFIKDSVYINSNKLYFYNVAENNNLKRYTRYNAKIKVTEEYTEIDNTNSKTNFFKDTYYRIVDFFVLLTELIGDILMG